MTKPLTALIVAVGVALIITASVKSPHTRGVIDALGSAGHKLEQGSLGG